MIGVSLGRKRVHGNGVEEEGGSGFIFGVSCVVKCMPKRHGHIKGSSLENGTVPPSFPSSLLEGKKTTFYLYQCQHLHHTILNTNSTITTIQLLLTYIMILNCYFFMKYVPIFIISNSSTLSNLFTIFYPNSYSNQLTQHPNTPL